MTPPAYFTRSAVHDAHGRQTTHRDGLLSVAISVAIFLVALALRLPSLMLVPAFTDEGVEALWALDIALGRHLPLTGADAYYGPLFYYLLAGIFAVVGVYVEVPRLTVATFGAGTVVAVYWLARLLFERRAGLAAAALAATSPVLVIQSSHFGWSNSLTPFFMTVTVLVLTMAVSRSDGRLLLLAGVLAGATVQIHPTTAAGLVGLALWLLTSRRSRPWLKRPALYAAAGLAPLVYAPVIANSTRPDLPIWSQASTRTYAFGIVTGPLDYLVRVAELARNIGYGVGAGPFVAVPVVQVLLAAVGATLLAAALAYTWRRHHRHIVWAFASTVLVLPILVKGTSFRYYYDLFPLGCVAIGGLAAVALRHLHGRRGSATAGVSGRAAVTSPQAAAFSLVGRAPRWLLTATAWAVVAGVAIQVLVPLATVPAYYAASAARGEANAEYFRLVQTAREHGACAGPLLLDPLDEERAHNHPDLDVPFAVLATVFVLTLEGCPPVQMVTADIPGYVSALGHPAWMIVPERDVPAVSQRLSLNPVDTFRVRVFSAVAPLTLARVRLHD